MNKIAHEEFFSSFKDSLGIEGTHTLMAQMLMQTNIPKQEFYSIEEALRICDAMKTKGGFISIIAGILASRFLLR